MILFTATTPRTRAAATIPVVACMPAALVLLPARYADACYLDQGQTLPVYQAWRLGDIMDLPMWTVAATGRS